MIWFQLIDMINKFSSSWNSKFLNYCAAKLLQFGTVLCILSIILCKWSKFFSKTHWLFINVCGTAFQHKLLDWQFVNAQHFAMPSDGLLLVFKTFLLEYFSWNIFIASHTGQNLVVHHFVQKLKRKVMFKYFCEMMCYTWNINGGRKISQFNVEVSTWLLRSFAIILFVTSAWALHCRW